MDSRPVIFISAVSKELHNARQLVANTLALLGYDADWQDIFGLETGDLKAMLRRRIDASAGVIQLIGQRYGAEAPQPDADFGRVSYTQYETLYARQKGKKVWYLFLDDDFSADPCDPESEELRQLQQSYRQRVRADIHLFHPIKDRSGMEATVLKLRDDLASLRRRFKQWTALVLGLLLVLVLGVGLLKRDLWEQHQDSEQSKSELTEIKGQNARLLEALHQLSSTLAQQSQAGQKEDEPARLSRAYAALEEKLHLLKGSLEKELPKFAEQLLQRNDTSALDRANALFVTQKFPEAEAQALKAKDEALAAAGKPVADAIAALRLAGQSAEAQIHYAQAMEHYRVAAALTSKEHEVLPWLDLQNDISRLYYLQGRYQENLAHTQAVWQTAQQAGKHEAREVLAAHMNYATALWSLGKAAEAEQEHQAVLLIQERMLGAEHPDTLMSRGNLANALQAQGKHAEAEQENRAVWQIRERVLGAEHPDTLMSRGNLGSALQDQGKHAEAEQEHRAVWQIRERVLGAEHPDTLGSRMNLANALQSQGKNAEAEQEYRAVLPIQERVLVTEHPDVALSCYNLALCLEDQQKLPEALAFMQRAEQVRAKILGPDHPKTKKAKAGRERIGAAIKQSPTTDK